MASGDLIAQTMVEKTNVNKLDYRRTGQFFAIGLLMAVSNKYLRKVKHCWILSKLHNLKI